MLCLPYTSYDAFHVPIQNKDLALPVALTSFATKDGSQTAHEGGLAAARVGGNTDDDGGLAGLESHVETGGNGLSRRGDTKTREGRRRREGGDGRDGGEGEGDLHGGYIAMLQFQAGYSRRRMIPAAKSAEAAVTIVMMIHSTDENTDTSFSFR